MGLQTGTKLAVTKNPIIDPSNLKILAYEVDGPLLSERPALLRIADVRELSDIGMIIDSNDEFVGVSDVISLHKIYDMHFNIVGMPVVDEAHHKLGKVSDYSLDTDSFIIQQLIVRRGLIQSLSETELLIHRSQIIEINDDVIIVKTTAKKLDAVNLSGRTDYMNPFRSASPQTNSRQD